MSGERDCISKQAKTGDKYFFLYESLGPDGIYVALLDGRVISGCHRVGTITASMELSSQGSTERYRRKGVQGSGLRR